MTNQTRFFVTKIVTDVPFEGDYVIVNGRPFHNQFTVCECPGEEPGEWEYEEWFAVRSCRLDEVPPHRRERTSYTWYEPEPVVTIWTRCYYYTPPKTGSRDYALSVAKLLLDPAESGKGQGRLERIK